MSKLTKIIIPIGLTLIIYGFVCRMANIYFFWESKYVGWLVIAVGAISFLLDRIREAKKEKRKSVWEKIIIGMLIFILVIQVVLVTVLPQSEAYTLAKEYCRNDAGLKNEVGEIKSFGFIPVGAIESKSTPEGEAGAASIYMIAKGTKRYRVVTINVEQPMGGEWRVVDIDY